MKAKTQIKLVNIYKNEKIAKTTITPIITPPVILTLFFNFFIFLINANLLLSLQQQTLNFISL